MLDTLLVCRCHTTTCYHTVARLCSRNGAVRTASVQSRWGVWSLSARMLSIAGLGQTGIVVVMSDSRGEKAKCPSASESSLSAGCNLRGFDSWRGFCMCSSFVCCLIMHVGDILLELSFRACQLCDQVL